MIARRLGVPQISIGQIWQSMYPVDYPASSGDDSHGCAMGQNATSRTPSPASCMCERTQKAHTCTYSIFGSLDKDTNSRTAQMKNEKKNSGCGSGDPGRSCFPRLSYFGRPGVFCVKIRTWIFRHRFVFTYHHMPLDCRAAWPPCMRGARITHCTWLYEKRTGKSGLLRLLWVLLSLSTGPHELRARVGRTRPAKNYIATVTCPSRG